MSTNDQVMTNNDYVELLIQMTKNKISEGNTFEAFNTILHAIRLTSGEESIISILEAAKQKIDMSEQKSIVDPQKEMFDEAIRKSESLMKDDSILKEQGNELYLRRIFEEGEGVLCKYCNALIPIERMEAHGSRWCPALDNDDDSDEDN